MLRAGVILGDEAEEIETIRQNNTRQRCKGNGATSLR